MTALDDMPELLRSKQVAAILNTSESFILKGDHGIPKLYLSKNSHRSLRFHRDDVKAYIAQRREQARNNMPAAHLAPLKRGRRRAS